MTRELYLQGVIAEESWYGDEVSPRVFREELYDDRGDITLWIHSPGGDCVAAAQIYNMLREYPGEITVKIDGLAASAASVIAMAGDKVLMSPVSMMMIHNPSTLAYGDASELKRAEQMLCEIKESIVNAYACKTKMARAELSTLMDNEYWMNANAAREKGFCDAILYESNGRATTQSVAMGYTPLSVKNSLRDKIAKECKIEIPRGRNIQDLEERLALLGKDV